MSENTKPLPAIIDKWKETGSALATTLSNYLDLCLLLSKTSQENDTFKNDIISQFDSVLQPEGLLSVLSEQLIRSQEVIAMTRNKLLSPIYNFPAEILSKIFLRYVYDEDSDSPVYMEFTVRALYNRLHTLLSVCSVWRGICLSMPMLWKLIPVIRGPRFTLSYAGTSLSLKRSGTLPLDLAVMIPQFAPDGLVADLTPHASRFRTINIIGEVPYAIQTILIPLMEHNLSDSLSELSLCVTDVEHIDRLDNEPYYMFYPDDESSERSFSQLMQSLTRLRFNGATFDWSRIVFSSRLVELRLHSVIIGRDSLLLDFLNAVSTAPELQKLELTMVTSFPDPNVNLEQLAQIRLPKLRSLVLDDLHLNTLIIMLRSITPTSYQLTLGLTEDSLNSVVSPRDLMPQPASLFDLLMLFKGRPVETLLIEQRRSLGHETLLLLMGLMASITTLKIHGWKVDSRFCGAFKRQEIEFNGWEIRTPKIKDLSFSNVKIDDVEGLRELVRSYSPEGVFFNGYLNHGSEGAEDWQVLGPWDDVVEWIAGDVPSIGMSLGNYNPVELQSAIWQLW